MRHFNWPLLMLLPWAWMSGTLEQVQAQFQPLKMRERLGTILYDEATSMKEASTWDRQQWLILLGHATFGLLFIWSVYYAEARMLAYDSAWQAFQLIQTRDFLIVHNRFLLMAIQWLPLLVVKLGGSLQAILYAYSISWVLFPYLIFLVLAYGWKVPKAALLLLLSLTLTTGATFFYVAAELPLSLAIFCLFVGWVKSETIRKRFWEGRSLPILWLGVAALLIILASFGRVLIGFAFFFFLAFQILRWKQWDLRQWTGLFLIAVLWYGIRFLVLSTSSYTGEVVGDYLDLFGSMNSSGSSIRWDPWLRNLGYGLWMSYVLTLGLIGVYVYQKRYWVAGLVLLGLLIYAGIGIAISPLGVLGTDHYLMIWGGMIGWPLLVELDQFSHRQIAAGFFVLVLLGGILYFTQKRRHFVKRVAYIEFLLQEGQAQGFRKIIVPKSELNGSYMWVDWALGVESLLLSSLHNPGQSATVFSLDPANQPEIPLADPSLWLGPHFSPIYRIDQLDQRYFQLPKESYQEIHPPLFPYKK